MIYLSRVYEFCASHRLFNPLLSEAENFEIFRECSYANGHGHNYELHVTVRGIPDPKTGMVVNIVDLDAIVHETIISKCDHRHLNFDVEPFSEVIPSAENLVRVFWEKLVGVIPPPATLSRVKLFESRSNSAEMEEGIKKEIKEKK